MFDPIDITITDPRDFDGNAYEVADRAIAQVESALNDTRTALAAAFLMARNADMERNMALGKPPAGSTYGTGPQGRKFAVAIAALKAVQEDLAALRKAVAYDPKNPPRA